MRVSEIYNKDVYSDSGQYLGEVREMIIDLERGEVSRILMEEPRSSSNDDLKKILQKKSVLYKSIKNVGDVVLVSDLGQKNTDVSSAETTDLLSR